MYLWYSQFFKHAVVQYSYCNRAIPSEMLTFPHYVCLPSFPSYFFVSLSHYLAPYTVAFAILYLPLQFTYSLFHPHSLFSILLSICSKSLFLSILFFLSMPYSAAPVSYFCLALSLTFPCYSYFLVIPLQYSY